MTHDGNTSYVERIRSDTRDYLEGILEENGRLRRMAASLESEVLRLREEQVEQKRHSLELREELERFKSEKLRLELELGEISAANGRYLDQAQVVERQNNDLAHFFIASDRLAGTSDRERILLSVEEILANFVACEEFVVQVGTDSDDRRILLAIGIDEESAAALLKDSQLLAEALTTGEVVQPPLQRTGLEGRSIPRITAVVPLRIDDRMLGAIVLFRLLPQKTRLEEGDLELLRILGLHGGTALVASGLRPRPSIVREVSA